MIAGFRRLTITERGAVAPAVKYQLETSTSRRFLQACARHRVAVEINANPWRLDLDCVVRPVRVCY
jgi:hypothetical protein